MSDTTVPDEIVAAVERALTVQHYPNYTYNAQNSLVEKRRAMRYARSVAHRAVQYYIQAQGD